MNDFVWVRTPTPQKQPRLLVGLLVLSVALLLASHTELGAQMVSSTNLFVMKVLDGSGNVVAPGDNANSAIRVNMVASSVASGGTSSNFGSAIPSTGTAAGASDGTNMQSPRVFDVDSGAGTQYALGVNLRKSASGGSTELVGQATMANSLPVTIASDQSAVSVSAAQSGTWTVQPGNTANTTAWKVDGSAVTQPVSGTVTTNEGGTWTVQPGNTANTTAWLTKHYPVTACGGTVLNTAWQAVPTTLTVATSTTTCVSSIIVGNTNATAQTILVSDNQGTAITVIPTISLLGNSWARFDLGGTQFTSGIKVQAGGTGMTYAILGYQ